MNIKEIAQSVRAGFPAAGEIQGGEDYLWFWMVKDKSFISFDADFGIRISDTDGCQFEAALSLAETDKIKPILKKLEELKKIVRK